MPSEGTPIFHKTNWFPKTRQRTYELCLKFKKNVLVIPYDMPIKSYENMVRSPPINLIIFMNLTSHLRAHDGQAGTLPHAHQEPRRPLSPQCRSKRPHKGWWVAELPSDRGRSVGDIGVYHVEHGWTWWSYVEFLMLPMFRENVLLNWNHF